MTGGINMALERSFYPRRERGMEESRNGADRRARAADHGISGSEGARSIPKRPAAGGAAGLLISEAGLSEDFAAEHPRCEMTPQRFRSIIIS